MSAFADRRSADTSLMGHNFPQSFLSIWSGKEAISPRWRVENGVFGGVFRAVTAQMCHFWSPAVGLSEGESPTVGHKKSHSWRPKVARLEISLWTFREGLYINRYTINFIYKEHTLKKMTEKFGITMQIAYLCTNIHSPNLKKNTHTGRENVGNGR